MNRVQTSAQVEESHHTDEAEQHAAPAQSWAPVSPPKSILRQPSEAPSSSPKPLVYDYASTASPASRRVSTVSFLPSPKRTSMHRRLSHDASVQVELPIEDNQASERQIIASAKKVRRRRSSMQSRRTSLTSIRGPATYAGFQPVGFTDAGAMLCEWNGTQFELVVDDVQPEEQVGTQCQPLDIEVEMDLLFENMDKCDDDESESVMEVEVLRSEAVPPPSCVVMKPALGNQCKQSTSVVPLPIPVTSLPDMPTTPGPDGPVSALPDMPVTPGVSAIASVRTTQGSKSVPEPMNADSGVVHTATRQGARCRRSEVRGVAPPSPYPNSLSFPITGKRCSTAAQGPRSMGRTPSRGNDAAFQEHYEAPSTPKHAPAPGDAPHNVSPQHDVFTTAHEEELVEAAVISGIDPDEDEEIVATTAHAAIARSSYPPFALVDEVLGSMPNDFGASGNINDLMDKTPKSSTTRPGNSSAQLVETEHSVPEASAPECSNLSVGARVPDTAELSDRNAAHSATQTEQLPGTPGQQDAVVDVDEASDTSEEEENNKSHAANEGSISPGSVKRTSSLGTVKDSVPGPIMTFVPSTTALPSSSSKGLRIERLAPISAPEPVADENKAVGGASRTGNAAHSQPIVQRLHLNMFQVDIKPEVTAYQLAVLKTITPNTKAKLDNLRHSNVEIHLGASASPVNDVVRNLDADRASLRGQPSKKERGTSPDEENSSKLNTQTPSESHAGSSKKPRSTRADLSSHGDLRCTDVHTNRPCAQADSNLRSSGLQHPATDGGNARGEGSMVAPEPQQPEVLRRMSGPVPAPSFANVQPEVEVIELDCSDTDDPNAEKIPLVDTVFSGLVSPAPLARRLTPRQSTLGTTENQVMSEILPVGKASRTTSKQASTKSRRTSSRLESRKSRTRSSSKSNMSLSERIEMQTQRNSTSDHHPCKVENEADHQPQEHVVFEEPLGDDAFADDADFDQACGVEDMEHDQPDGDFNMEPPAPQSVVKEEHKRRRSSSTPGMKKSSSIDSYTTETTNAPLVNSDSKEEESPIRKELSLTPTVSKANDDDSPSPVMRKKLRKPANKRGVKKMKKTKASTRGQKRQWRELAHLPTQEVRKDDGPGPRRSKRQRFPRLKYWKNEVVAYERRVSQVMPTVSQVLVDVGDTDSEESWMPRA